MLTRYRFRPSWPVTAAFVVLLPVLIGLGIWQLDRSAQKAETREQILVRGRMEPVDVNRDRIDKQAMTFRRATVRGRYHDEWTIYLDNKVRDGVPGYEVLTPLVVGDSGGSGADAQRLERVVLVNRGWVSWGESRETLPGVAAPEGIVKLAGRLIAPPDDYFTLENPEDATGFERRWQNLDLERYREATGLPVAPLVLQLTPGTGASGSDSLARRAPQYDDSWIERHRAYAVQWFALALTLVILYVALNLKKRDPDD